MDVPMTLICCCRCRVTFAITADMREQLEECHNTFYCPAGHSQYFPQQTDEEKWRGRAKDAEAKLADLRDAEFARLKKQRERNKRRRAKEGK